MRTLSPITMTMAALLSCGAPVPGEEGREGERGADGERGAQGPAGRDAVAAGSRLRPVWLVGTDGTRQHAGFYDTERRERCQLRLIEGGSWEGPYVCAPPGGGFVPASEAGKYVRFSLE